MPDFGDDTLGVIYLVLSPVLAIFGSGVISDNVWNSKNGLVS